MQTDSSKQGYWRHTLGTIRRTTRGAVCGLVGGGWKQILLRLVILLGIAAVAAFIYVSVGLAPTAASAGHWPVTRWFLQFAMRNAVETRAMSVKAPALDDMGLMLKGAGHYATGCAPCHGAPGQERSLVARKMTPEAPFLPPKIQQWSAEELFWIVKNGIKYTAMPAWPSQQREDEVWAMVAFLQEMPKLTPEQYTAMAYGEAAESRAEKAHHGRSTGSRPSSATDSEAHHHLLQQAGQKPDYLKSLQYPIGSIIENCVRCHGERGIGRGTGAFPKIAGQNEAYLLLNLRAFASGQRHSGVMEPVAAALEDETLQALAHHYSRQPPFRPAAEGLDPEAIKRGRDIVFNGRPEKGVPSCRDCHGPGAFDRNPIYPQLAGQYADYLFLQLNLFKNNKRGDTAYAEIMHVVAKRLSQQEMRDAAAFYASLEGEPAITSDDDPRNRSE